MDSACYHKQIKIIYINEKSVTCQINQTNATPAEVKMCITKYIIKHKIFYFTIKNISRISTINQARSLHHFI